MKEPQTTNHKLQTTNHKQYKHRRTRQELNTTPDQLSQYGYKYYNDLENYAKRNTFLQQHNGLPQWLTGVTTPVARSYTAP
ncbi:hypothetical protein FAM09_27495 [Niastella caeni]|uniref:Uncharacterized protein n=1 Tax=Niastella caeni TaxID=2569763 RepID=A0A4S8HC42_9BACT|nr:hypothetical protein [Niastella caeni]THU32538.1 hypothetical protein FAM09_27495 [Niastella caeni]